MNIKVIVFQSLFYDCLYFTTACVQGVLPNFTEVTDEHGTHMYTVYPLGVLKAIAGYAYTY